MTLLTLLQKYLKEDSFDTKLFYLNMLKKSYLDPETLIDIPKIDEDGQFSSSDFTDRDNLDQAVTATEIQLSKLFSSNHVYQKNWTLIKDIQLDPEYLVQQISLLQCELSSKSNRIIEGSNSLSEQRTLLKQYTKLYSILNLDFSDVKSVVKFDEGY